MKQLLKKLISNKPRSFVTTGILLTDTFLFITSLSLSFWLCSIRLPPSLNISLFFLSFLIIKLFLFYRFKVYHALCRYASIQDFKQVTSAHGLFTLIILFGTLLTNSSFINQKIILIDFFISVFLVLSFRFFLRYVRKHLYGSTQNDTLKRYLIIGAGKAGSIIANEILDQNSNTAIVGFLDDDIQKKGLRILQKPVLGNIKNLQHVIERYPVDEILIAIPSANRAQFQNIIDICKTVNIPFKTTPGLNQIINNEVSITQFKEVDIEDLLGREEIKLDQSIFSQFFNNKTILVTGAAGSIGSEICKQLSTYSNATIIALDHYENGLFFLQQSLPDTNIHFIVTDVKDALSLEAVFQKFEPNMVIHAAAHKHVPLMEDNPYEVIQNNILGTKNCLELASKYQISHFLLISTDKAVNPKNCMGASKRCCEMLMQIYGSKQDHMLCFSVRFGNVLGSNGSVIPIFRKQIKQGGPVTVTHPEMTRYFMTIPEAVSLVLQTPPLATGHDVFILDMGNPVKIIDLAKEMIKLSGFKPDIDIKINISGTRPGEKIHEILSTNTSLLTPTKISKILKKEPSAFNLNHIEKKLTSLISSPFDQTELKDKLFEVVSLVSSKMNLS